MQNLENHTFEKGDKFVLLDKWKDGDEGVFVVIEDRENYVLAEATWTNLRFVPQEAIRKHMIKELVK